MNIKEKKDKILEVIKNIPLQDWVTDNYYSTELNGIKIRTYPRGGGNPPGVEVAGMEIWGTKVEMTSDIFYSVHDYFKEKEIITHEQKVDVLYEKMCD